MKMSEEDRLKQKVKFEEKPREMAGEIQGMWRNGKEGMKRPDRGREDRGKPERITKRRRSGSNGDTG